MSGGEAGAAMGAPRLKVRPITAAEAQSLNATLADKRLPAKVHERYRITGGVGDSSPCPEVRAIASKYGDPEDILREEAAVPIPGINAPGDYWEDYANDTVGYWLNQREERNSGKSPYMVKVLSLQLRAFEDR